MAYFNAIIRDKDNKLIAKTYLTDLTNVPWTWKVTYNHKEVSGSKLPKEVLCGPTRPLVITKRSRDEDEEVPTKSYNILIFTQAVKKLRVKINSSHTVADVGLMLNRRFDLSACEHGGRFLLNGRRAYGKEKLLQLVQEAGYYVDQEDADIIPTMEYYQELTGGGCAGKQFSFVDMDGKLVSGTGKAAKEGEHFKAYDVGLNLIGKCSNESCISQRYLPKGKVIYKLGFQPFVRLTPESCTFVCPACQGQDGKGYGYGWLETFKPTNILVSGARAEIRSRKEGQIVKTVPLESETRKYVMFEDGDGDDNQVLYQWIEIYTVPLSKPLHDCAACDMKIHKVADESKKPCGHAFHTDCVKKINGCIMCFTQVIEEARLEEMLSNRQVA